MLKTGMMLATEALHGERLAHQAGFLRCSSLGPPKTYRAAQVLQYPKHIELCRLNLGKWRWTGPCEDLCNKSYCFRLMVVMLVGKDTSSSMGTASLLVLVPAYQQLQC